MTDGKNDNGRSGRKTDEKIPDPELAKRVFNAVWQTLAADTPGKEFYQATLVHIKNSLERVRPTTHGTRIIGPEEATRMRDNTSDYMPITFDFEGLEAVKSLMDSGTPVAFVTWHHGARHHADFGVSLTFPQTAIFARLTFQYGRVFTIPMQQAPTLSLVKMNRFLREGRPIYYYLDGPPIGKTVKIKNLGVISNYSTAPISIIKAVEGVHIVPITNYYRDGDRVEYIFHPALPPERLTDGSEKDILAALLNYFERDLRRRGPNQVMWPFLTHRESLAREQANSPPVSRPESP